MAVAEVSPGAAVRLVVVKVLVAGVVVSRATVAVLGAAVRLEAVVPAVPNHGVRRQHRVRNHGALFRHRRRRQILLPKVIMFGDQNLVHRHPRQKRITIQPRRAQ